jgi:hypothetical protein
MEVKKSEKVSVFKRYWLIIKNGLFLFGLTNRLAKIGIDINPYYWVQEEFEPCEVPIVRGGSSHFNLRELTVEEFKVVAHIDEKKELEKMINGLENGQLCIALEDKGRVAAYTFAALNNFSFKGKHYDLKPNEAYLLNMWTFHDYRGRNIAPYLRYKVYELLGKKGIDTKYSITDYFNKSSIKFKKKLNSKPLYLYLHISLFNKLKWHFTLKKY